MLREEHGQATVEAALLLPVLMLLLALLVQPACILYTRGVMQAAAAEGCRLVAVPPVTAGVSDQAYRAFVLRRLSAVPNVPLFHKGGDEGWDIAFQVSQSGRFVTVSIATSVQPLPLLGVVPALLGADDGEGGVRLAVEVSVVVRPDWLEGSYVDWSWIWP